jgi:hypothetical protein
MGDTRVLVPSADGDLSPLGLRYVDGGPLRVWRVGREALLLAADEPAAELATSVSAATGGFTVWLQEQSAGVCLAGVRVGPLTADPYFDFLAVADQLVGPFDGALDPPQDSRAAGPLAPPALGFPRAVAAFASAGPVSLGPGWRQELRPATTWSVPFVVASRTGPLDTDAVAAAARMLGCPAVGVELRGHDRPFGWLWCDWAGESKTGEGERATDLVNLWEDFAAQVGERTGALRWPVTAP